MINFENSLLSPRYPGEHVSLASSLSSPTHSCSVSNGGSEGEVALLRLMERTGYNIIQENGQRKYGGPPPGWSHQAPPPVKGSEVFVGKLPRDLFEDELVPVFEKVGRIYEVRLMMDFSGTNRGYAFVMFFTPEEAARAVRLLNNFEIRRGRFIGVVKSVDNCRLFIGGLPKNKSRQEVFDEMKRVTEGVRDVIIYSSVADKSKSRGFAFVEYDCHKSAAMARRRLIPGRIQLWNHNIAVDWALPEPDVDDDVMSKVTALYVRNLLLSTNEEMIRQAFNRVPGVSVSRVKKLRDFAFVHFVSREQAFRAMVAYNNRELDGSIVEVVWAKPAERCRTSRSSSPPQSYSQQCSDGLVIHGAVRSPCKQKGLLSHSSSANISSQIPSLVGSDSITRSSTVSPSPFLQPPPITSQVYDVDAALMRMMCHPPPILPQSDSTGVHRSVANHPTLESSSKISNACINHLATMFDQQSLGGYIYNKRQSNFVF